jgi:hypothetical protein
LFIGLAQLIVQATKTPGEIAIEATAGREITPAKLTVRTKSTAIRPTA